MCSPPISGTVFFENKSFSHIDGNLVDPKITYNYLEQLQSLQAEAACKQDYLSRRGERDHQKFLEKQRKFTKIDSQNLLIHIHKI